MMFELYKKLMLEFFPDHSENKMKNEGNVELARRNFIRDRPSNLDFLLMKRFKWMNNYITKGKKTIELGSGAGFSQFYIDEKIILTDLIKRNHIHRTIDAMNLTLQDQSVDIFILSHMIHHISKPVVFLKNLEKKLKPEGFILIQEINTSFLMRLILYIKKHEGYSYKINIFDEESIANNPKDPWSANCAIIELLFKNHKHFEEKVPLKIIRDDFCEFLIFPLSGGVISKAKTINLPLFILKIIHFFDKIMIWVFPSLCAFGRSIVLKKIK